MSIIILTGAQVDSSIPYCSPDDLAELGIEIYATDEIAELIQDGSRIVDKYCDTVFGAQSQTVTVSDVRKPLVKLPTPFTNVTAVSINGGAMDASTYIVEPWGLRLYSLNPLSYGWPNRGGSEGGSWPYQASGAPYGAQIAVTATFGYPGIPRLVNRAARLICRDIALGQAGSDGPYAPGQVRYMVGGFDAQFNPHDPHPLDTTGSVEVDRLLYTYKRTKVQVA